MDDRAREAGWDVWVKAHAARLLLFARQQTRSEADAQDVLQESMVESWERQANEQPPALALVFATIRRRAIDLGRQDNRRTKRERVAQEGVAVEWFDTSVEDREMSRMIQSALRQIQADYRDVITLKAWGGLTFAEIGSALEISPNTAASRYRYGLAKLRKLTREVLV